MDAKRGITSVLGLAAAVCWLSSGSVRAETVGHDLIGRAFTDTATGSIFMLEDGFTQTGAVTDWSFYHAAVGKQITPLIFQPDGGSFRLTGIGATRLVTGIGTHTFDFDLVAGSSAVGPGTVFGWKDGSNGSDNLGTPEFTDGVGAVVWLGPGHTTFSAGQLFAPALALPRTYSVQAMTVDGGGGGVETIGNSLVDRPFLDGAAGSMFVMTGNPFTAAGSVDQWSFFNNNDVVATKQITPMLIEDVGGSYVIRGIGATRMSSGTGAQSFAFDLVSGSAAVGPNVYFAWKDGGNGSDNEGVPAFDTPTGDSARWFGGGHTTFGVGENLGAGTAFGRTYSIQANSDTAVPAETVVHGQSVIDRAFTDSFHGSAVLNEAIPDGGGTTDLDGRVASWKFFNNNAAADGLLITPLLVERVGTDYVVRGIGTTRTVTDDGEQSHTFAVVAGTDTFDWSLGTFHIGVRYGSADVSNTGVVDFDNGTHSWSFFGDANPVGPISVGSALSPLCGGCGDLRRDYSVQFTIHPVPEPATLGLMALVGAAMMRRRRGA